MAPRLQEGEVSLHVGEKKFRAAILGCGMMGQEHISYMMGCYCNEVCIDYLCDPHEPSLQKSLAVMKEFAKHDNFSFPTMLTSEEELLQHAPELDLLVIATPNHLHTDSLLRWGEHDLTILVEKPVATSPEQVESLLQMQLRGRVWVGMEYRYMPAIAKLLELLPRVGDVKMVSIRENRFPFLHKVGAWNRDPAKTGDSLVEKCCHFFDLFRLVTGREAHHVQAMAQRGINYGHEEQVTNIIDSAYVLVPFGGGIMACLELCMFADGSRHQEEVIVTGTKGRLEAYLPENKVYSFARPSLGEWKDRSVPPPKRIQPVVYDCSTSTSSHDGYHYGSTATEWSCLLRAMREYKHGGAWEPHVSLEDGIRAVRLGLAATNALQT